MSKRQEILKPFDVNEVLFVNRIVKLMNYAKENVPMASGKFSTIKLISDKSFNHNDIKTIQEQFNKKYGSRLKFENSKHGICYIGYLSKS